MEYERQGYLPEAMLNFLALLGWSPGKEAAGQELFTSAELAERFDLRGISGGDAVFNPEKLDWFNQQYIARLAPDELGRRVKPLLAAAGMWRDEFLGDRHAWFFAVLVLLAPRARRLDDFVSLGRVFFSDTVEYEKAAVEKHLHDAGMREHLLALDAAFTALADYDPASLESALRAVAELRGVKPALLIHAVRVALTGRTASPGLFEVLALLGRDRAHARLAAAVDMISSLRA
jgi:glutamyl-tRNA synthetase